MTNPEQLETRLVKAGVGLGVARMAARGYVGSTDQELAEYLAGIAQCFLKVANADAAQPARARESA